MVCLIGDATLLQSHLLGCDPSAGICSSLVDFFILETEKKKVSLSG